MVLHIGQSEYSLSGETRQRYCFGTRRNDRRKRSRGSTHYWSEIQSLEVHPRSSAMLPSVLLAGLDFLLESGEVGCRQHSPSDKNIWNDLEGRWRSLAMVHFNRPHNHFLLTTCLHVSSIVFEIADSVVHSDPPHTPPPCREIFWFQLESICKY